MERATGIACRQVTRAGLLALLAAACATIQDPPGGPPDPEPPLLLAVVPDSGVVVPEFEDEVAFQFDEVIEERGLEDLFLVSPRHETIDVNWHRKWIGVRPEGGWRDSVIYSISMLPGISDLRNNRSDSTRSITFSTGGAIPNSQITGNTIDWESARIAPRVLIEAIRPTDSLTYFTLSDSTGRFSLNALPPGEYHLVATIDQNNNQLRERRESFDTVTVDFDSTYARDFWMFVHDTVGPRVTSVSYEDSLAIEIEYSQSLSLLLPLVSEARVLLLPDSVPVMLDNYYWRDEFDSLRTAQADSIAVVEDSLAALAALADTTAPDSLGLTPIPADSLPILLVPVDSTDVALPGIAADEEPDPNAPDPAEVARVEELLAERDQPSKSLMLLLGEPLAAGQRYVIESTVSNLEGATTTSARVLATPEPVPADTT